MLRTVMLHRPGDELRRLTPRNNDQLLFDGLPWVDRAQDEHDAFADLLRGRGVTVLLLGELLTEAMTVSGAARMQGISAAVDARRSAGRSPRTSPNICGVCPRPNWRRY